MGDEYGSTTGAPTPDVPSDDPPKDSEAMAHLDASTEDLADRERQDSFRAEVDHASHKERMDEGRLHSRSEHDRD